MYNIGTVPSYLSFTSVSKYFNAHGGGGINVFLSMGKQKNLHTIGDIHFYTQGGYKYFYIHGDKNIFTHKGDKHFYIQRGQTYSVGCGSSNDDVDAEKKVDVSEVNILASKPSKLEF